MTIIQIISRVFLGVGQLLMALILFIFDTDAFPLIVGIYSFLMIAHGIYLLIYFLGMASNMVGGKNILYRAILFIDLGIFTGSLASVPSFYVLLYLAGTLAFSGAIDILRANEARKMGGSWRTKIAQGIASVLTAVICVIFMRSSSRVVDVYAVGLGYSAVLGIISAFRPVPAITIQ